MWKIDSAFSCRLFAHKIPTHRKTLHRGAEKKKGTRIGGRKREREREGQIESNPAGEKRGGGRRNRRRRQAWRT